ncbi:hypothetical protein EDF60_1712 [Leucobacter luti]|nr:hypothetical protein [Leucobacter luti]TCK41286.1 hypothetical protein EDF60_1712 [Leucobacter luti]
MRSVRRSSAKHLPTVSSFPAPAVPYRVDTASLANLLYNSEGCDLLPR